MNRVPTHEPYDQHENINPEKFSAAATDVTLAYSCCCGIRSTPVGR
jgi:hypothetical protein